MMGKIILAQKKKTTKMTHKQNSMLKAFREGKTYEQWFKEWSKKNYNFVK